MIKVNDTSCSGPECIQVKDIMRTDLKQLNDTDTVFKAYGMFKHYGIKHLPVVGQNRIVGMLSINDINGNINSEESSINEVSVWKQIEDHTVDEFMTIAPKSVKPSDSLLTVSENLANESFHAYPVVENEDVIGIITTTDVIKQLLKIIKDLS